MLKSPPPAVTHRGARIAGRNVYPLLLTFAISWKPALAAWSVGRSDIICALKPRDRDKRRLSLLPGKGPRGSGVMGRLRQVTEHRERITRPNIRAGLKVPIDFQMAVSCDIYLPWNINKSSRVYLENTKVQLFLTKYVFYQHVSLLHK